MSASWVGKALGGVLGFVAAGPPGLLVGLLLGHRFDQGLGDDTPVDFSTASAEISRLFFAVTFEAMGHVAKADGRVSEEEIRAARRIMHGMELTPEQTQAAIAHFTAGKDPRHPLGARLALLAARLGARRDLARAFVEIQVHAAVTAGELGREKRRALWEIASGLGVGRVELAQIEALIRAERFRSGGAAAGERPTELDAAYRVLGIAPHASDAEVKKAYRRLINRHHPDKLIARGLPQPMAGVAERKTHEVRAAYERIKAVRGFK